MPSAALCTIRPTGPASSLPPPLGAAADWLGVLGGGIGLGLAIARSNVHAHGGTLRLENRKPNGLVATVTLPGESG